MYCVLTLGPESRHSDLWTTYRRAKSWWDQRIRKRLQRMYGKVEYVQTWEQHRDGYPHVNVVLTSEALRQHVEELGYRKNKDGRDVPRWRSKWWGPAVTASGFGKIVWAETIRGPVEQHGRGLASYLVKLSRTVGVGPVTSRGAKLAAELNFSDVKDQTPVCAPPGFRRWTSSRGLIPPRNKGDGSRSGTIRESRASEWGWGDVERHLAVRQETASTAQLMADLESRGLPVPAIVPSLPKDGRQKRASARPEVPGVWGHVHKAGLAGSSSNRSLVQQAGEGTRAGTEGGGDPLYSEAFQGEKAQAQDPRRCPH